MLHSAPHDSRLIEAGWFGGAERIIAVLAVETVLLKPTAPPGPQNIFVRPVVCSVKPRLTSKGTRYSILFHYYCVMTLIAEPTAESATDTSRPPRTYLP